MKEKQVEIQLKTIVLLFSRRILLNAGEYIRSIRFQITLYRMNTQKLKKKIDTVIDNNN